MATEDQELTAIFERIARAIPGASVNGLAPRDLLSLYAELLERGESVTLMHIHPPTRDPQA